MLRKLLLVLLIAGGTGCDSSPAVVGGRNIDGKFSAIVSLKTGRLDRVRIDVYEDFTCGACQRFETQTLPALISRYPSQLSIRKHYLASPSAGIAPLALYELAAESGKGDVVAAALMRAGLGHGKAAENDGKVLKVAEQFDLRGGLEAALANPAVEARIREQWRSHADLVAFFPFVVIEEEIAADNDEANLKKILDSILQSRTQTVQ